MSAPREVTLASVRKLKPNKRNARTHSKKQILEIVELVRRYGWTYPILIDEDGYIIAGHARYQAALYLRLTRVPIIVMTGLSDAEKRALALADNKVAANAGWDRAALAAELGELAVLLPECDLNINITGFEAAEIDNLLGDFLDPEADPADELPAPAQTAVSRAGDLWQLGTHHLKCGNALSPADLRSLMGAERATTVIADAPFNVRIKSVVGRGRVKYREFAQASGEMSSAQFTDFLRKAMTLAAQYSINGSIALWFIDWRHIGEMLAAGRRVYGELINLVVWNKTNAGQGSFYRSKHELIFVYKNGDGRHINNIELGRHGRNRANVWEYGRLAASRTGHLDNQAMHPTQKPVAMIADALRDVSRRGDIVLDPFMGSGTCILAAEKVGRRGYGLEIDPLYVDVAVRRWQTYTNRDAILKATGQTFDEVAEAHLPSPRVRRSK